MPHYDDDVIRAIYEPWAEGDFSSSAWMADECEIVVRDGPTPGIFAGREEMGRAWGEVLSAWEGFRTDVEEIREIDDERVLVLARNSGRGRGSGLELGEMSTRGANLLHFHNGKVLRLTTYWDRQNAFADLGLTE